MRVGAFELREPLPDLREPHALTTLSPWIDVGRGGEGTLSFLEDQLNARELGKLRTPGLFYDFTRYRPIMYYAEGRRQVKIPNTIIRYAKGQKEHDFLFIHCLEPHMLGETYADSILRVLERLKVKKFCTLGSMYDAVPHTRPLMISGSASEKHLEDLLKRLRINDSGYQGPTTINILVSQNAPRYGIETMTLIEHLPHYTQLEEDYSGQHALLSVVCYLYSLPMDLREIKRKGEEQYRSISQAVKGNPQIAEIIKTLEISYDSKVRDKELPGSTPPLSPGIEKFLREIDKGFGPS